MKTSSEPLAKPIVLCLEEPSGIFSEIHTCIPKDIARVFHYTNPKLALEALSKYSISLVIVAPEVQGMDGILFLEQVQNQAPSVIRILLNHKVDIQQNQKALETGVVSKNWNPSLPLDTLDNSSELRVLLEEGLAEWNTNSNISARASISTPNHHLQIIRDITQLFNKSGSASQEDSIQSGTTFEDRLQDIQNTLRETTEIIGVSMHYDVVSIYTWEEELQQLVLRSTVGLKLDPDKPITLSTDEGLTGYVYQTQESLIAMPASEHPQYKFFPELGEEFYESYIGVPISSGKHHIGVLVAQTKSKVSISTAEETLFSMVASGLASLLDVAQDLESTSSVLQGRGVSRGYALGPAYLLKGLFKDPRLEELPFTGVDNEIARLKEAFVQLETQQRDMIQDLTIQGKLSQQELQIFEAHLMLLQDPNLYSSVEKKLTLNECTAELSVVNEFEALASQFEQQPDPYLKERAQDFRDIGEKLLNELLDSQEEFSKDQHSLKGVIVVAEDILPSMLPSLSDQEVAGILTEIGGANSHTAILARSLGIPAICGVDHACQQLQRGETLLVDGTRGLAFRNPAQALIDNYERDKEANVQSQIDIESKSLALKDTPSWFQIHGNIGFPKDVQVAEKQDIQNIGLLRTEFAFMQYDRWPTVIEQAQTYERVARNFSGYTTIRTLDIGADKLLPYFTFPHEENPLLGLRSIRFSMEYLDFFKDQIRAILLGVQKGYQFRILLPMVTQIWELETARDILYQIAEELEVPEDKIPPLGVMVEVPGILYQLRDFTPHISFLAIGTNDLIQYMIAVDRNSNMVGHLYSEFHPAVLRALGDLQQTAQELKLDISVCGEMASQPAGALALCALGYSNLSVSPSQAPLMRMLAHKVNPERLPEIKKTILRASRQGEIERFLKEELRLLDSCFVERG